MTDDILMRAKSYLAHNAAESGADVLITDLIDEVESLRGKSIAALRDARLNCCDLTASVPCADCPRQPHTLGQGK